MFFHLVQPPPDENRFHFGIMAESSFLKTGLIILPTQTLHKNIGNPSKSPYSCIVLIPPKWVIQWPLLNESEQPFLKKMVPSPLPPKKKQGENKKVSLQWVGSMLLPTQRNPGFAIIPWNNPKKLEKPCITKGQYLAIFRVDSIM